MALAETVQQITKRKRALYSFLLWQFAQAADNGGSMARSLLKHLPKFSGGYRSKLFAAFQPPITLLGGFFQGGHLLGQSTLLTLSVIRDSTSTFLNATISEPQTMPISSPRAAAATHRPRFFFASVIVKVFIKTL
jgi:hypothetical protein